VLAVQPVGDFGGDKELRTVGVGTSVRHAQKTRSIVSQLKVFVLELLSVNTLTASSVTTGKVTALQHKPGNNAMKRASFEMKRLSALSFTLLTSAQASKVLNGLWDVIAKKPHDNPTCVFAVNGDVKKDLGRNVGLRR
jgi:hypothetical protein